MIGGAVRRQKPWLEGDSPPREYHFCKKRYEDVWDRSRMLHSLCSWWATDTLCTRINEDYTCNRFRGDSFLQDDRMWEFSSECERHCLASPSTPYTDPLSAPVPAPPARASASNPAPAPQKPRPSDIATPYLAPAPVPTVERRDSNLRARILAKLQNRRLAAIPRPPCYLYRPDAVAPANCDCGGTEDDKLVRRPDDGRIEPWGCIKEGELPPPPSSASSPYPITREMVQNFDHWAEGWFDDDDDDGADDGDGDGNGGNGEEEQGMCNIP